MADMQMLFPMESKEFWSHLKLMIEEIVERKNGSSNKAFQEANPPQKPLLKAKEVCELFQVTKPTVYDWMSKGKLKSIKIRSRRYFLWKDIEELIKESKSTT